MLRNSLYFGFEIAFKDFAYTILNRIVGIPNRNDLIIFFKENAIVLWGVGIPNYSSFIIWGLSMFWLPLKSISIFLMAPLTLNYFYNFKLLNLQPLIKLSIIFLGTFFWHLLFIAQGTIYIWPFLEKMVLLIIIYFISINIYLMLFKFDIFVKRSNEAFLDRFISEVI
jgi:hypothetical protein